MQICLSQGGPTTFTGTAPADQVLVGTLGGIYGLARGDGSEWNVAWRALEDSHISALQIEPASGTLFAGAYKGGIQASEDGGKTWTRRDDGLASDDVYSLSFADTGSGTKIYAGTEPAHLYESGDLGATWTELGSLRDAPSLPNWTFPAPPHVAHVKFIMADPDDPAVIYAAVEVGGLLKSRDGGATWEELHGFYADVHRIVISRKNPDSVFITTGDGLYHTGDGGNSWERMTDQTLPIGYPDGLVMVPGREELMFMSGARSSPGSWRKTHTAEARIGRSRDGGKTWQMLTGGLPDQMRGNIEAVSLMSWDGGFELFAGTTDGNIYYSNDEGEHWAEIATGLPPVSKSTHYRNLQVA